ncbi:MAG: type II toxin-antitoxin system RelE/ParE family toxin [Proteobacteria bacterium]|nr:type II toxin-antitoxin system RelE/ParE family toxin [Pseudomonadota bacterium]
MRLSWSPIALDELEQQVVFARQMHGEPAALRLVDRIEALTAHLLTNPKLGQKGLVEGTRHLVLADLPFKLVYRLRPGVAEIIHVYHTSQDR